ncbi:HNH endonuclease, partial [Escherichia coli]|nr:HNH endonuclease [Escherichia coli]
ALVDEGSTKASNRQVIKSLLEMLVKRKPDINMFVEKFVMLKFSNQELKNKRLIQYIFNRLELHHMKTGEYMPDSLTLEHIQPQSVGDSEVYSMIGNLLPLSKELNEKAGNKSVVDKLEIYKQSQYALVKIFIDEFENKYQGEWTPDHMRSRAAELSILSYNSVWKLGRE